MPSLCQVVARGGCPGPGLSALARVGRVALGSDVAGQRGGLAGLDGLRGEVPRLVRVRGLDGQVLGQQQRVARGWHRVGPDLEREHVERAGDRGSRGVHQVPSLGLGCHALSLCGYLTQVNRAAGQLCQEFTRAHLSLNRPVSYRR